jgi:hypothetical protein
VHWTSVRTERLDSRLERVTFFAGPRIVVDAVVARDDTRPDAVRSARVVQAVDARRLSVPYGNWLAYQPALLVALSVLFVLMTAVWPWRRLRNLDVAAALSLLGSVLLFQYRYFDASIVLASVLLAYLALRCAYRGLGPARAREPQAPLLTVLTPRLESLRRVRWLRVALAAVALVVLMVAVGSPSAVDVLYAVMEGATNLIHGFLPYGHMPSGIVHGDTYPILSYALYTPVAVFAPVSSTWARVDAGLAVAGIAALLAAWAVFRANAGARRTTNEARSVEQEETGLRAALAWLTFPPLLVTVSTGTTDVVLAGMLAGAILLWRRPTVCSGLLAAAGWFKLAPVALVPVCLAPLRGRRLIAALGAILAVSAPLVGLLLALGGTHGAATMVRAISYQFSRGSEQSIWGVLGISGLQPVGQACVLGVVAAAVVQLRRRPELALDRARVAALTTAILIGMQLTADYWAFLYLVWVGPALCVSVLGDPGPLAPATRPAAHPSAQLRTAPAAAG